MNAAVTVTVTPASKTVDVMALTTVFAWVLANAMADQAE